MGDKTIRRNVKGAYIENKARATVPGALDVDTRLTSGGNTHEPQATKGSQGSFKPAEPVRTRPRVKISGAGVAQVDSTELLGSKTAQRHIRELRKLVDSGRLKKG